MLYFQTFMSDASFTYHTPKEPGEGQVYPPFAAPLCAGGTFDPRVKLCALFFFSIAVMACPGVCGLALCGALLVGVFVLTCASRAGGTGARARGVEKSSHGTKSHVCDAGACARVVESHAPAPGTSAWRVLKAALPVYVMGAFFVAYHALVDNIVVGVLIALRITLLAWASILFVQTTNEATIGATLRSLLAPLNRLGVPTFNFISALVVALRFIPLFKEEATMLKAAQMARGAAFEGAGVRAALKAAIGLMVPLIVGVFKRVDALAEAMDARAYGATVEPTSLVNFKMKPADRGVLVGIVALFVVAMVA